MRNLFNSIKGNGYKLVHSNLLWVHLGSPIAAIIVFALYYSYSPWKEEDQIAIYLQTIAMAFPLMIAIVTTVLYDMDMKAGKCQSMLVSPYSKIIAHMGNIVPLLIFGLFSTLLAVFGFGVVYIYMGSTMVNLIIYWKVAIVIFGANISLYIIQYILCYSLGKGISLGWGIIGTLLSALLYLGLGDIIWRYIPFGYGIRLSSYYMSKILNIETFKDMQNDYKTGSITVLIITSSLLALYFLWSKLWQATKETEE